MFTWMTFRPVYKTLSITIAKFRRAQNTAPIALFEEYQDKIDGIKYLVEQDELGQAHRNLRDLIKEVKDCEFNAATRIVSGNNLGLFVTNLGLLEGSLIKLQGRIGES